MYAHKGGTKKLKRQGLHRFALDQPSINGIGLINRSEKMKRSETVGNSRKRSETVGNGRKHDQAKTCPTRIFLKSLSAQRRFFFEGPKVSKGKRLETVGDRTFARQKKTCFYTIFNHFSWTYATKQQLFCRVKVRFPTVSNRFPLDSFGPSKKKRRCAERLFKKMRVGQVLAWSCFRPFPTVSDRFRPFHFFWTIN